MSTGTSDVVVVGGGVVGLSVAYAAAQAGLRVAVVERGALGQESSWAGAGILSAAAPTDRARSPFAKLLGLSAELHAQWAATLRQETGIDTGYVRCGGFELGFDADDAHALRSAAGHHRKEGVAWVDMTPEQVRGLEPALAGDFTTAYQVPEMAQVRNPRHLKALTAACARLGVTFHIGSAVIGFLVTGDRVAGARTGEATFHAATTVVTTGAWSRGVLSPLGIELPVKPIRGQIALLACDVPQLRHIVMMGKQYLVPRPDGRVLVGSTEEDVGFDKRATPSGIRGLLDMALRVCPALGAAHLERTWGGLRPCSADSRPFIGPVPGYGGILVAAGHFRSGLQLSTGTGHVVTQCIRGESPAVPLHAFRLDRPMAGRVSDESSSSDSDDAIEQPAG
jgi:glycine oxidase